VISLESQTPFTNYVILKAIYCFVDFHLWKVNKEKCFLGTASNTWRSHKENFDNYCRYTVIICEPHTCWDHVARPWHPIKNCILCLLEQPLTYGRPQIWKSHAVLLYMEFVSHLLKFVSLSLVWFVLLHCQASLFTLIRLTWKYMYLLHLVMKSVFKNMVNKLW